MEFDSVWKTKFCSVLSDALEGRKFDYIKFETFFELLSPWTTASSITTLAQYFKTLKNY